MPPPKPMEVGVPASKWAPNNSQKLMLGGILSCMYAMRSLSTTYSKDDTDEDGIGDKFPYNPNSAVMSTEAMKLVIAGMLFRYRVQQYQQGLEDYPNYTTDAKTIAKFAIPALLYMASNNLSYLALRYLDTPTYQVLANSGIPIVATVQRLALKSKKSVTQWIGVLALCLGMMVIGADKFTQTADDKKNYDRLMTGLIFLLGLEIVSACSGVYTEFLLKSLDIDINFQNCLLYTWGVIFTVSGNLLAPSGGEFAGGAFFTGFDTRTWIVVLVNALLGQVVSRVMKHLDNVAKFFCASFGMIIVTIVSSWAFGFNVTLLFNIGVMIVIVAGSLYIVPASILDKKV